jgi:hypothetical protein
MIDELSVAQREAEDKRLEIEETLGRIQSKIDRSTEDVRTLAMTPFRVAGNHPLVFAAVFFAAGVIVGLLSEENEIEEFSETMEPQEEVEISRERTGT